MEHRATSGGIRARGLPISEHGRGSRGWLQVVCVRPVHSIAQTIGWILWEYAREKGGRLRRAAVWALVFALTRVKSRTDASLQLTANTFQAVFRRPARPQVLFSTWRNRNVPAPCAGVPTMLIPDEQRLLTFVAEEYFSGAGCIVDAGC